jgi:hypothetical protein
VKCEVVYIPETPDDRKAVIAAIEEAQRDISAHASARKSKFKKRLNDYEIQSDQLHFGDPLDIFEDARLAETAIRNVAPDVKLSTVKSIGEQIKFSNGENDYV